MRDGLFGKPNCQLSPPHQRSIRWVTIMALPAPNTNAGLPLAQHDRPHQPAGDALADGRTGMATVKEIAERMLKEVATKDMYHDYAAHNIQRFFGSDFVHQKASRDWAIRIRKDILNEFRKLSGDAIVWERGSGLWRKRTQSDRRGRLQY